MPELRDTGVRNVVCGENVVIYQPANLYDCQLGDNVFVGPFVEISNNADVSLYHHLVCRLTRLV